VSSTYIIAEAGVNHNGSIDRAEKLIDAAADAGADAVKFQTFCAEQLLSKSAPKADYQIETTGSDETQFEMLKKLELNEDAHYRLNDKCIKTGIQFLSTPFDEKSIPLLAVGLNLPYLKISSGDLTNAPLLFKAAQTGKLIILSTGMSVMDEIRHALGVLAFGYLSPLQKPSMELFQNAFSSDKGQEILKQNVRLLHCTSEYPTPFDQVNLRAMDTLRETFGLPVGLSDHTEGINVPIAGVARGAQIIEKHFTLDRNLPGPDHRASLEPEELKMMIVGIRQIEKALGSGEKEPSEGEMKNILIARKSLVAAKYINNGDTFSEDNLTVKRPGAGVSPFQFWGILGTRATRNYQPD